ncbi:YaiI/YqxD family protein [uncultured Clostridium sp.]|uniref:YaiI/YqxD family protein n=1 Tax=uncultured Clostridium sp. TaxID=59620 RepID=UPI0025DAD643|nr:YaiI/YqxD family protein [uncultured Clostridium sp.]
MKIIIDGDASPGISIIEKIAESYKIPVIIFCDIHHFIQSDYSMVRIVDSGFQSVDMYVANETKANDIVISQDYGVAAICLSKKAAVMNTKGYIYNNDNIERLLEERHIYQKIRKGGGRTANPKKRTSEDDDRLKKNLIYLIQKLI